MVWVAAPTVAVLVHLLDEFRKSNPGNEPSILLGRQQFVSVYRVSEAFRELREDPDPSVAAAETETRAWLEGGGKPRTDFARRLASHIPGVAYLAEDLFEIAPFLRAEAVRMEEADELEPAQACLNSLLEQSGQSRLVICTQAMVLLRILAARKGDREDPPALPFSHLLVDEVHELEAAAANLQSGELSLLGLRSWLRQSEFARSPEMCEAVSELIEGLRGNRALGDGVTVDSDVRSLIVNALKPVAASLKKGRKGDDRARAFYLKSLATVISSGDRRMGVHFTAIRRFPSIYTGPVSVGPMLGGLWQQVKAAVGVSGTIFLPTLGGGVSSGYMEAKLAVPPGRLRTVGPVISNWVRREPVMLRPDAASRAQLCYPSMGAKQGPATVEDRITDEEQDSVPGGPAYERWVDSAAAAINQASASAAGGTLVLCTSFRDVSELKHRLRLVLGERMLCHERGLSVASQKNAFIAARSQGIRPVWLASGSAWTGLDITDEGRAAKADLLLTDLMILRVPIGLNRTSTQFTRRRALGYNAVLFEAAFVLRQGLGRLMRRQGLTARRIWLLDGRIDAEQGYRSFLPFRSLFDAYPQQQQFTLPPVHTATGVAESG